VREELFLIKRSRKFKTTISDDGKYLKYHPPGTINIHVLQAKFDNERHDENGRSIHHGKREDLENTTDRNSPTMFECQRA
jgi:hypothetical protein